MRAKAAAAKPARITRTELDRLVRENQGLVHAFVRRLNKHGVEYEDLIQEGNLGLVMAAEKFNPARGVQFMTYAMHWVRARVLAAIERHVGATNKHKKQAFRRADRTRRRLQSEGKPHDAAAVAAEIGVHVRYVEALDRRIVHPEHWDLIADPADGPEEQACASVDAEVSRDRLYKALGRLTRREREIILRRYLATNTETLASLGQRQGRSRERIRQIEVQALAKLRAALDSGEE